MLLVKKHFRGRALKCGSVSTCGCMGEGCLQMFFFLILVCVFYKKHLLLFIVKKNKLGFVVLNKTKRSLEKTLLRKQQVPH
jgi:hypothetical protein